jgi:alpha-tubulin suppressor-like RCC1 family protein
MLASFLMLPFLALPHGTTLMPKPGPDQDALCVGASCNHASTISQYEGLRTNADRRVRRLDKYKQSLAKHMSNKKLNLRQQLDPAPSPPPSVGYWFDKAQNFSGLYNASEARRVEQAAMCDQCKAGEEALVWALDDALKRHMAAQDKALALSSGKEDLAKAKELVSSKAVEWQTGKAQFDLHACAQSGGLADSSGAPAYEDLVTTIGELKTTAAQLATLRTNVTTMQNSTNSTKSEYSTAAALATAADDNATMWMTNRETVCAGLDGVMTEAGGGSGGSTGGSSAFASNPMCTSKSDASGAVPVAFAARGLHAAGYKTCVITTSDRPVCWGGNTANQIALQGADSLDCLNPPLDLSPDPSVKVISLSAGTYYHACALLDSGDVKCFGEREPGYGGCGYDEAENVGTEMGSISELPPVNLGTKPDGTKRTAVALGGGTIHSCAILDTLPGDLKCWGGNQNGVLGQDDKNQWGKDGVHLMADLQPINLGEGRTAASVCGGGAHTCALLDNNKVKCWGDKSMGALGTGNTNHVGSVGKDPFGYASTAMADLDYVFLGTDRTAVSLACGMYHTCVIMDNGKVKCWGYNYDGQLGQDDTTDRGMVAGDMEALQPVNLGAGYTAVGISAGQTHTCAILSTGKLKCWGGNTYGQLGVDDKTKRGNTAGSMAALQPVNLGTALTVQCAAYHTCAILDNLDLKCWGNVGGLGYKSTATPSNLWNKKWGDGDMADLPAVPLATGVKIPAFPECS